jgi:hypothetical protein
MQLVLESYHSTFQSPYVNMQPVLLLYGFWFNHVYIYKQKMNFGYHTWGYDDYGDKKIDKVLPENFESRMVYTCYRCGHRLRWPP